MASDDGAEAAIRRVLEALFGRTVCIASAEDVVSPKLEWAKMAGSERQIADVAGILRTQGTDVEGRVSCKARAGAARRFTGTGIWSRAWPAAAPHLLAGGPREVVASGAHLACSRLMDSRK
jgi:hypothetical protein